MVLMPEAIPWEIMITAFSCRADMLVWSMADEGEREGGRRCMLCLQVLRCPGIELLRFKPAYNPYTEPSMEVFSYHRGAFLRRHS